MSFVAVVYWLLVFLLIVVMAIDLKRDGVRREIERTLKIPLTPSKAVMDQRKKKAKNGHANGDTVGRVSPV
ncbi:hypothetical protein BV898_02707 [Hypsibius exemplaris]|uniref:Uncharacterized protein n=1 Tax=Hypsibius exemplaris TaxID=2072580 RepID=A0A1W0X885_HYPEX|nr:hypothetical protein BV898_02707 [Hypsibius exemplaris]